MNETGLQPSLFPFLDARYLPWSFFPWSFLPWSFLA